MITLQTITTIELSSICNMVCSYCINRLLVKEPTRQPGIMSDDVFNASCELLKKLVKRGTQKEVNLNGNGESLLDAQIFDRIATIKAIMQGYNSVQLCTNGTLLNSSIAKQLKASGIDRVDVSPHNVAATRKAIFMLQAAGIGGYVNNGVISQSHNWAGQLEKENSIGICPDILCLPLIEGRGYIQSEGNLSPCCYDFRNLGVFGHVFDDDILDKLISPFELCTSCHQKIPESIINQFDHNELFRKKRVCM